MKPVFTPSIVGPARMDPGFLRGFDLIILPYLLNIMKTRLFKYTENFTIKNENFR